MQKSRPVFYPIFENLKIKKINQKRNKKRKMNQDKMKKNKREFEADFSHPNRPKYNKIG